ncbi:hypothetical protein L7F22_040662 [Adiantum nelumboides]|nr:hypothetical protein [Adiantum nelumboides]
MVGNSNLTSKKLWFELPPEIEKEEDNGSSSIQYYEEPPLTGDVLRNNFSSDLGAKKGCADNFLDYDYVCTDIGAKAGNSMPRNMDTREKSWFRKDGNLLSASMKDVQQPMYPQGSTLDGRQSSTRLLIDAYGNIQVPPILRSPSVVVLPQRDGSQCRESFQKRWEEESHKWNDKIPKSIENQRHLEVSRKSNRFSGRVKMLPVATDKELFRNNLLTGQYDAFFHAANQSLPDAFHPNFESEVEVGVVRDTFGANPPPVLGHQFPADQRLHESPQHSSAAMQLKFYPLLNPPKKPHRLQLPSALCSSAPLLLHANGPSSGLPSVLPRPALLSQSHVPQGRTPQSPQAAWVLSPNPSGHGNIPVTNQTQVSEHQVAIHSPLPDQAAPLSTCQSLTLFQAPQSQFIQVENTCQGQSSMPERAFNSLSALPLPTELLQTLKQLQEHLPALHNVAAEHGQLHQSQFQQSGQQQWQQQQKEHQQGGRQQHHDHHYQQQQHQQQEARHQHHNQGLQFGQLGQIAKGDGSQSGTQNPNGDSLLAAESVHPPERSFRSISFSVPLFSGGQPQLLFPASGTNAWSAQLNNPFVTAPVHAPYPGPVLQPPLPPGPPPLPCLEGNPPPQMLNTNISGLLSSLLAQGLISPSSSTPLLQQPYMGPPTFTPSNQNMAAAGATVAVVLDHSFATAAPNSLLSQGPIPNVVHLSSGDARNGSISVEFKADVLRERHDLVIDALYASSLEQCKTCGLRCKSQHDLLKHMECHAPENTRQHFSGKHSRSWFLRKEDWLKGVSMSLCKPDVTSGFSTEQSACKVEGDAEPAVPADEDQAACTLCGEPFEDFYDDETDLWMYKGAIYLNTAPGMDEKEGKKSIVHAKCQSTPALGIMSEGLLSPNQRQHSLPAFQGGSTRHEHQGELEEDQIWKKARH